MLFYYYFLFFLLLNFVSSSNSIWKSFFYFINPFENDSKSTSSSFSSLYSTSKLISSNFNDFTSFPSKLDNFESSSSNKNLNNYFFSSDSLPFPSQSHGTTTLIVKYRDSLIITVDSKSSMKNYIVSDSVKKVRSIGSNYVATMAGGASDCHYFLSRLGRKIKRAEGVFNRRLPLSLIVKLLVEDINEYNYLGKLIK